MSYIKQTSREASGRTELYIYIYTGPVMDICCRDVISQLLYDIYPHADPMLCGNIYTDPMLCGNIHMQTLWCVVISTFRPYTVVISTCRPYGVW